MVESLIMAQQFEAAQTILQHAPELQDDELLRHYARQASLAQSKPVSPLCCQQCFASASLQQYASDDHCQA